ncbi:AraC family transcriptional regulator [Gordonia humi]|nr:AraC family transcriptional regulator [Gordonia humi]
MVEIPRVAPTEDVPRSRRGILCATDDFDVYRSAINESFYPARLEIVGGFRELTGARMLAIRLSCMTVGIVRFGADVLIDPGAVDGYHIDVPTSGALDVSSGRQFVVAGPDRAAIYTPGERTFLERWSADNTQVSIKIDRNALEQELGRIIGRPVVDRVRFDLGFDLASGAGLRWATTLQVLLDTIAEGGVGPDSVTVAQVGHLERALIAGLLVGQENSMSDVILNSRDEGSAPAAVRRVLDRLEAAPGSQYTVTDLAEVAGVGVRQLQKIFMDQFGMTPSQYVRNMRLDGVRGALIASESDATVSDIAFRWGFNHLGRFAQYYEQKFGESPSKTLREHR